MLASRPVLVPTSGRVPEVSGERSHHDATRQGRDRLAAGEVDRRLHDDADDLRGYGNGLNGFHFVWEARQAQIDATLCFLITLSLYGLLRHLSTGPAPGWFVAGWAAAGLGVITKEAVVGSRAALIRFEEG